MSDPLQPDDVERLAGWVDPDSRATYLSLFADVTDPGHREKLEDRRRQIRSVLPEDAIDDFEAAWEAGGEQLRRAARDQDVEGVAAVVSPRHDRQARFALGRPVPTRAVWDTSPYVRPLARFLDEYEDLAVVRIDGESASIHLVEAARSRAVGGGRSGLSGRHSKGGWSQKRFAMARETQLKRFLDDVVDRLDRLVAEEDVERILIVGSGQVRRRLENRLPDRLADRVTAAESVDDDATDAEIVDAFVDEARRQEIEDSSQAVDLLRAAVQRDELAVTGPFATARAARDGRVDLLVVRDDVEPGGAKCEAHGTFFERGGSCSCGSEGTPVDLANEAVEHASRSDATIEFVPPGDPWLAEVGGIGGCLRW